MDKLKMQTANKADENYRKLAELFPNAVTETIDENGEVVRAIDKDVLMQEIAVKVVDGREERYQFTWPDKKKSVLLANAPISKTLRPCREESVDFDNTENLYIEGDNLEVLKLLQETYLGKIKMIYIDPPYNTGNDFVYEDNFVQNTDEYLANSGQFDEDGNRMVQNTESNLNNNVGLGRYNDFPRVMLGTDGMHSDMIRSAQSSYFIAGLAEGGMSPLAAYQRLRAVHAHIQGHNAPGGGANNLVILNYDSPTPLTQDNFPGHFCYAFDARNVESVISQGRLIVDHGRLAGMDEADILAYANEQARRLWALL